MSKAVEKGTEYLRKKGYADSIRTDMDKALKICHDETVREMNNVIDVIKLATKKKTKEQTLKEVGGFWNKLTKECDNYGELSHRFVTELKRLK